MQNRNAVLPGEVWRWDSNNPTPTLAFESQRFRLSVNASAMVRGDRHTPNQHSYNVGVSTGPSGFLARRANATSNRYIYYRGNSSGLMANASMDNSLVSAASRLKQAAHEDSLREALSNMFGMDLTTSVIETARGGIKPAEDLVSIAYQSVGAQDPYRTHGRKRAHKRIRDAYIQFKQRHPDARIPEKVTRVVKNVGKTVLINNYVVQPLISDIAGSLNHLRHKLDTKAFEAKGSGRAHGSVNLRNANAQFPGFDSVADATIQGRAHTKLRFRVPANYYTVQQLASFNPLQVGYQLIPLSFVVDWFYDVGGWLQQVEARAAYNHLFTNGYTSSLGAVQARHSILPGSPLATGGFGGGSYKRILFSRETHGYVPNAPKPKVNLDLGSGRMLNAAALLAQLLNRR